MTRLLILIYILASGPLTASEAPSAVTPARADSALRALDSALLRADTYIEAKRRRIGVIREMLVRRQSVGDRYAACRDLYDEYLTFQYDSTSVYARLGLSLALRMGDESEALAARCRLMDCYTNGGFFKEAFEVKAGVDSARLAPDDARKYYASVAFLYQNMYMYVAGAPVLAAEYEREQHRYYALSVGGAGRGGASGGGYMRDSRRVDAADLAKRVLRVPELRQPSHEAAVDLFVIGDMCARLGRKDEAVYYLALSAINDVRTATLETAATRLLAAVLFDCGRVEPAIRYIRKAAADARFYHSRLRQVEIGEVLPAIEAGWYDMQCRQRMLWTAAAALALALAAAMAFLAVKLHRSRRRLEQVSRRSHERGLSLARANASLEELNGRLREADAVKYQFIVQSFYSDSAFVDLVETKLKAAEAKLRARQYSDLTALLRDIDVRGERARMSAVFDQTFLKLFPTFVEDYNRLFPPDRQASLAPNGAMPTELRIFALMRLGISDTRQVGRYLNLSQNSIYVYRAKAKAAATVDKDEFDSRIMKIGF